ncbi:hypothetical protein ACFQ2B_05010 [Streptomyces stramineus]
MKAFDLTAGRYLNVHQCVYFSAGQHYTAVLPNTPNANFNTGTNASLTADTALNCQPGGEAGLLTASTPPIDPWAVEPGLMRSPDAAGDAVMPAHPAPGVHPIGSRSERRRSS